MCIIADALQNLNIFDIQNFEIQNYKLYIRTYNQIITNDT